MAKTSQDAYNSGNEFMIMAEQLKDIVEQFIHETAPPEFSAQTDAGTKISSESDSHSKENKADKKNTIAAAQNSQTSAEQDGFELF